MRNPSFQHDNSYKICLKADIWIVMKQAWNSVPKKPFPSFFLITVSHLFSVCIKLLVKEAGMITISEEVLVIKLSWRSIRGWSKRNCSWGSSSWFFYFAWMYLSVENALINLLQWLSYNIQLCHWRRNTVRWNPPYNLLFIIVKFGFVISPFHDRLLLSYIVQWLHIIVSSW